MAVIPIRFLARQIAKTVVRRGIDTLLEETTGQGLPDAERILRDVQNAIDRRGASPPEEALQMALDRGEIDPTDLRALEANIMTDFNDFMSIGLSQCGSDRATFRKLVEVWNREKEDIRRMSQREVRQNLRCP